MSFIFTIAGVVIGASIALTLLVRLALLVARRRPKRFWRRALLAHAVLIPVYVFVVTPGFLGWFVSGRVGTRGDERAYAGPRIAADGTWVLQSRDSLRAEARPGGPSPDPALIAGAKAAVTTFETDDGVRIRAFLVPPRAGPPRCTVVLVHGLFRGGLELEAPASMFRDLGAETLLVEMRNHGGSARARPTFGRDERLDVLAAVAWVRRAPERAGRKLVLYAVSLGTAAVMRAAPDVPALAGLVLDAPMDDLRDTAHRMLSEDPRPGKRGLGFFEPFRTLTIWSLELWNGFRFSEVRPIDALARLDPDVPVLVISGGADERMPPRSVTAIFDRLPTRPAQKTLWIRPGSDHGQVWNDDPAGYREHLAAFLAAALRAEPAGR
jgi:alpha-beta hydrolase superfamily lysophospholipase